MQTAAIPQAASSPLAVLLRGEPQSLRDWMEHWGLRRWTVCLATIVVGAGLYGAAMGYWRSPSQAVYVAIKFPLILLLTALGNALLNAMLAPLLGVNISLRQAFVAILMSFSIASAILGSFSPLVGYLTWNVPPLSPDARISDATYTVIQLTHVGVIAFAGIVANLRLVQLLRSLSGNAAAARRVLIAWLAGNLFFGSQLSWILRPFIGSPGLPVEFVRETALKGNFYETVFRSILRLLSLG
jgi:hypothetical protein